MTAAEATRHALLADILARPAEDMPRLILADLLDEYGGSVPCRRCRGSGRADPGRGGEDGRDPCRDCVGGGSLPDADSARSEFVRVQCELERRGHRHTDGGMDSKCRCLGWGESINCHECNALRRRERELLRLHEGDWLPPAVFDAACWGIVPDFTEHRRWRWSRGFVAEVTTSWNLWLAHHKAALESCPLEVVRLAESPGDDVLIEYDFSVTHGWPSAWTSPRFPGVRFVLPPPVPDPRPAARPRTVMSG